MEFREVIQKLVMIADAHASDLVTASESMVGANKCAFGVKISEINTIAEEARKLLKNDPDRLERAYRYLTNQMTEQDGIKMIHAGEEAACVYGLERIDDDGVLDEARERWEEHPELRRLAQGAVNHVARKWCPTGHVASAARDWALDLMAKDAKQEGIVLVEKE